MNTRQNIIYRRACELWQWSPFTSQLLSSYSSSFLRHELTTGSSIMACTHHHIRYRANKIHIIETIHFLVSTNCYYNNEFYVESVGVYELNMKMEYSSRIHRVKCRATHSTLCMHVIQIAVEYSYHHRKHFLFVAWQVTNLQVERKLCGRFCTKIRCSSIGDSVFFIQKTLHDFHSALSEEFSAFMVCHRCDASLANASEQFFFFGNFIIKHTFHMDMHIGFPLDDLCSYMFFFSWGVNPNANNPRKFLFVCYCSSNSNGSSKH